MLPTTRVAEDDRHFRDPQLLGGLNTEMVINDLAVAACENRGILTPNSRMLPHMRSTTESFLRGLRAQKTRRSIGQI